MKKLFYLAMMGAIAFTGAIGFTACSSEDDVANNPTFDGESVKTSFALNIPYASKTTRMAEATVQGQATPLFRGMQDMYLFPLNAVPDGNTAFPYVNIDLGDLDDTQISTTQSSHIYSDVNIAVGTSNFLFYAEATQLTNLSTKDNKFDNGILTKTVATTNTNTSEITFDLNQVVTSDETDATEAILLGILNGVADVEYGSPAVKWNALTYSSSDTKFQSLVELYNEYTKDNRNGSGPNVKNIMQSLYNNAYYIKKRTANDTEVVGYCDAIMTEIANYFGVGYESTLDGVASTSSPDYLAECYILTWKDTYGDVVKDFPKNTYCLPYGVAEIDFDETTTKHFAYSHATTGTSTLGSSLTQAKISYPASLQYFCNTPAKTTNKVIQTTGTDAWPVTPATWDSYGWSTWADAVAPTTRSIALRNNINYGVACMKATVKCATGATTLEDNSQIGGGAAENIDVTIPTAGFTVTGFLIGGQPQQVDWQFLPSSGTDRDRVIYDKNLNGTTLAAKADGAYEGTNYTLVLDNYTTASEQEKVNVAVELVNNSTQDFYGLDGLIKVGQTFYLIGQLDPTSKTVSDAFPASPYRFPAAGIVRVFIQDYTTTANFTINDLKKAYATIPDLRVARLQLGLSVDLQWRAGVTYEVDL